MRRRRYQKGSLQLQRRGKGKTWIVLYYDTSGDRRCKTLGPGSLTKSQAGKKRAEFMRSVNGGERCDVCIVAARRQLLDAIASVQAGRDPIHVIRDPAQNDMSHIVVVSEVVPPDTDHKDLWKSRAQNPHAAE